MAVMVGVEGRWASRAKPGGLTTRERRRPRARLAAFASTRPRPCARRSGRCVRCTGITPYTSPGRHRLFVRMHRAPQPVMAGLDPGLDPAIPTGTGIEKAVVVRSDNARGDGRVEPGHDGLGRPVPQVNPFSGLVLGARQANRSRRRWPARPSA